MGVSGIQGEFLLSPVITRLVSIDSASQVVQKERICLPMQETQEMRARFLGRDGLLEEEMATHSSILAWEIPWTDDPGGLHSMGSQTQLSTHNNLNFSLRYYRPFSFMVLRELYILYLVVPLSALTITKHHKWPVFHPFRVLIQGWVKIFPWKGGEMT